MTDAELINNVAKAVKQQIRLRRGKMPSSPADLGDLIAESYLSGMSQTVDALVRDDGGEFTAHRVQKVMPQVARMFGLNYCHPKDVPR